MSAPILATKLYIPPPRPEVIRRARLLERLNEGRQRKLTLIAAPAGFGKTTLVSSWIDDLRLTIDNLPAAAADQKKIVNPKSNIQNRVAWLSLDEGDNDLARFLAYLVAALQTIVPDIGRSVLAALQSPQPPPPAALLTPLLNEISVSPDQIVLVLDDYHVIESKPIDQALVFLLEYLPPQLRLVIATREDPPLPLARLRVEGQLTELRAADLRFTPAEAAAFLNQVMGLNLPAEAVAALEQRTEGWIAGLQLAALSMQKQQDAASFIQSFTGSHRFVLDYLVEEVLLRQPEPIQSFLLRTSILNRLCGPLCETVLGTAAPGAWSLPGDGRTAANLQLPISKLSSQATLEYLEQANLFIIPLDNERRWYRYHHLFADLLRQQLRQQQSERVAELHQRASRWYEENDLELEAFQHAAAANDLDRAERLLAGRGMPLHFRGAATPVLHWLESLPAAALDARPSLWVTYASVLTVAGQNSGVEEKLQAAEAALAGVEPDDQTRNLIGHIAAIRALLAATQYQVETIIAQSRRALEYLHPANLPVRTATTWKLGLAYQYQGDRAAARQAYSDAIASCEASGNIFINILATTGLGLIQEADTQLRQAAESYRRVLRLVGEPPQPAACEAMLGLARLAYEWNDLDAARQHGQQSLHLARQIEMIDTSVGCNLLLARLKLAGGDVAGAAALLTEAEQFARRHNFEPQLPEIAAVQVLAWLRRGELAAAAHLAEIHTLPLSRARVRLAQDKPAAALALLKPARRQAEAKDWADERLKALLLEAVAYRAQGDMDQAMQRLGETLALAEPGGFIRLFVDEGAPVAALLAAAAARGLMPDYTARLLAAFPTDAPDSPPPAQPQALPPKMVEPLSERELEILRLVAEGLSNREISQRLFLALSTVKGHNRNIYGKLQVQRRTEAVARARELGLL